MTDVSSGPKYNSDYNIRYVSEQPKKCSELEIKIILVNQIYSQNLKYQHDIN